MGAGLGDCIGQQMREMGRRHQVDVMRTLGLELEHDLDKTLRFDFDAESPVEISWFWQ